MLNHFLLANELGLHPFPIPAVPEKRTCLEEQVPEVAANIERREVHLLAVLVSEETLSYIQLERHQRKLIHEEHKTKNSADQSAHVGEELVNFVEGSFVGCLRTGFHEVESRIGSAEN